MDITPIIDVPQLSTDMAQARVFQDFGTAVLDMSLETAKIQGGALVDVMRSSLELSVNPGLGANVDVSL